MSLPLKAHHVPLILGTFRSSDQYIMCNLPAVEHGSWRTAPLRKAYHLKRAGDAQLCTQGPLKCRNGVHMFKRHNRMQAAQNTAGVARLYDLVQPRDERLRRAFFYAFGDTLVASSLEQASRIAYGPDRRWSRVVTLQVRHCLFPGTWLSGVTCAAGDAPVVRTLEQAARIAHGPAATVARLLLILA